LNISIVTPWYGHPELAADYIDVVAPELGTGDEVIVVDNGDSPPLPFTVVRPNGNLGFAKGSNRGLSLARAEAVLFLNNDIALERRGWLDEIRSALEPGVLVGPWMEGHHAAVDGQPMPYLDGWCLAGMRDELNEIGGFDYELAEPAYYSDNLLCLEARAAGMTLRELRPGLHHKLNVTAGPAWDPQVQAAAAANRSRYVTRARELLVAA